MNTDSVVLVKKEKERSDPPSDDEAAPLSTLCASNGFLANPAVFKHSPPKLRESCQWNPGIL